MSRFRERLQRMKSCEYWIIAYRKRTEKGNLLHGDRIEGFHLLSQKRFVTQADPFLYTHQGKTWLFFEKQNLTDMKGTLWCRNLDDAAAKPVPVLEEPFHLSYPQVFRYGKYTYMIPETRNAGEVRLYRCVQFPGKWEKVETLLELAAVDTTLLQAAALRKGSADWGDANADQDGQYYAFTYTDRHLEIYLCRVEKESFHIIEKKKIYTSEKSEVTRPGGAFLQEDGKLYRCAQNCTDYYGQELIINEIDRLDETHFEEHEYCRLSPEQIELPGVNAAGIHTYNRNEQYEVVDILHREVSFCTILKKIEWKLKGSKG